MYQSICAGRVLGRARRVALVGGFSAGLQRSRSADVPVAAGSWVAGTCGAYGGGGVTAPDLGHAAGLARGGDVLAVWAERTGRCRADTLAQGAAGYLILLSSWTRTVRLCVNHFCRGSTCYGPAFPASSVYRWMYRAATVSIPQNARSSVKFSSAHLFSMPWSVSSAMALLTAWSRMSPRSW